MAYDFEFIGGDPSLDLVNTLLHRTSPTGGDELLTSGERAQHWFVCAGLLNEEQAAALDGETLLHSTRRLRTALDALYRPLARRYEDEAGTRRGLYTLNAVLNQGRERLELRQDGQKFTRHTYLEVIGPPDPTVQVARRAADLLARFDPKRLKECENPDCDLLFYDESRNGLRRWCRMDGCGNQQKQARFRRARRGIP